MSLTSRVGDEPRSACVCLVIVAVRVFLAVVRVSTAFVRVLRALVGLFRAPQSRRLAHRSDWTELRRRSRRVSIPTLPVRMTRGHSPPADGHQLELRARRSLLTRVSTDSLLAALPREPTRVPALSSIRKHLSQPATRGHSTSAIKVQDCVVRGNPRLAGQHLGPIRVPYRRFSYAPSYWTSYACSSTQLRPNTCPMVYRRYGLGTGTDHCSSPTIMRTKLLHWQVMSSLKTGREAIAVP
jgi:hypothetical protein